MLHVERHVPKCAPQLLIERCEQRELAEIEVDVFPVVLAADVFGEEPAVRCGLEVVGLLGQVAPRFVLVYELELDALGFQVIDEFRSREHRLELANRHFLHWASYLECMLAAM